MATRRVISLLFPVALLAGVVRAEGPWDVRDTAQPGQRTIYAAVPGGGFYGLPVGAGDLNGDGHTDIVLSPMRAWGGPAAAQERRESGEAYIVFGNGVISGSVELSQLPLPGAVEIIGASELDLTGAEFTVLDFNGDGFDDLALCVQNYSGPPEAPRFRAGAVALILGASEWPARIDLRDASGPRLVWIYGEEPVDRLGIWARAGHVDDDGLADLLIGADLADGPGNSLPRVGEAYLIYGASPTPARIDLADREGLRIVHISGYDPGDQFGGTVFLSDLDGDGRDDLIISAATYRFGATIPPDTAGVGGGDGPDNATPDAGETVIVFASPELPAQLHLSQPPYDASVTRIFGFDAGDFLGEEVGVGDLDGDGHADLAMGALRSRGFNNNQPLAGETHLFYGPIPKDIEFAANAPPPGLDHSVIYARGPGEISGDTLIFIDINRDGFDDLVLGSPCATPLLDRADAGIVDIFFGRPQRLPPVVLLGSPPPDWPRFEIWGSDPGDSLCYSLWWADFDADGYADPLINAMKGDRPGMPLNDDAGEVYALSGQEIARRAGVLTPTPTPTPTASPTPTPTPTPTLPPPTLPADLDGNGIVDERDLLIFIRSWHEGVSRP